MEATWVMGSVDFDKSHTPVNVRTSSTNSDNLSGVESICSWKSEHSCAVNGVIVRSNAGEQGDDGKVGQWGDDRSKLPC